MNNTPEEETIGAQSSAHFSKSRQFLGERKIPMCVRSPGQCAGLELDTEELQVGVVLRGFSRECAWDERCLKS